MTWGKKEMTRFPFNISPVGRPMFLVLALMEPTEGQPGSRLLHGLRKRK